MSMIERMRAAVRSIGRDPDVVARHIESEGWPAEDRGELEIAGLLSVLYREAGRLLALATEVPDVPCDYMAMPGVIELPGEDHQAAARWEVTWAKDRLERVSFDEARDQWVTGYAAAEQAVTAAESILKAITSDGMPAEPHADQWDEATRALRLALRLIDEIRAGRIRTTAILEDDA